MKGSLHSGRDAGNNGRLLYAILTSPEPLPPGHTSPGAGETFAGTASWRVAVISSVLCSTWHYIIQHVSYDILLFPQVENCLSQVCQSCVAALILFSHLPELEERRVIGGEERGDSSMSQNPKFPWSGTQDQVHHLFQPIAHRTGISPCKTDFAFLTKSLFRQEKKLTDKHSFKNEPNACPHTHCI